jgi:hypothetical protein
MNSQRRTLIETHTSLSPADVLHAARAFFTTRNSLYAAFIDQVGPTHVTMRGQGGEELVIAATPKGNRTLVTGSSYLFDAQISRFFATLPPAEASA